MLIMRKHVFHTIFLMFFLTTFLAGALDAAAQERAESAGASVGGLIPRSAPETLGPVAVITRRDIELSGARNMRDLLADRGVFNAFGVYRPFLSGRYAILINGRRAGGYDGETFPLSAVERVEILSDNTAALYGGDAVGGAINILLRRDFKGFEVRAGAAGSPGSGRGRFRFMACVSARSRGAILRGRTRGVRPGSRYHGIRAPRARRGPRTAGDRSLRPIASAILRRG